MKFTPNLGDLIWVKWVDHCAYHHGGWMETDKLDGQPVYPETVGFVVKMNKTCITVASTVDGDSCAQVSTRLRNCILDAKVYKKAKVKK